MLILELYSHNSRYKRFTFPKNVHKPHDFPTLTPGNSLLGTTFLFNLFTTSVSLWTVEKLTDIGLHVTGSERANLGLHSFLVSS